VLRDYGQYLLVPANNTSNFFMWSDLIKLVSIFQERNLLTAHLSGRYFYQSSRQYVMSLNKVFCCNVMNTYPVFIFNCDLVRVKENLYVA
jgi:hypothetical protein